MADFYLTALFFSGALSPAFAFVPQLPYDIGGRTFRSIQHAVVYCPIDGGCTYDTLTILSPYTSCNLFWRPLTFKQLMLHMFQDVAIVQPFARPAGNTPLLVLLLCGYRHILPIRGIPAKLTGDCALVSPQFFGYGGYGIAFGFKK
jgi:hypothetical protein